MTSSAPEAAVERHGPLASFPWHTQQEFALASATNVVDVLGGNQSGKTTVGAGIVSRLVRREGPVYRRLRQPEGRPLKIWVSPQTFEKYKSNWERRLHEQVFAGMDMTHSVEVDYRQSPSPVFSWDDGRGGGELWGKSQDQGFLAFESDVVDLIVFDEEPKDARLYTSAVQRLATTNGIIVLTFTPLLGLCLPGDVRVTTRRGMVPISEVVAGDDVAVRTRVAKVTDVHENGVRPLVEITTRRGSVLRCTPEHEWLAASSVVRGDHVGSSRRTPDIGRARKVRACDLDDGHWLAFNPGHPKFWPESDLSADDGYFLGQMVGDGSWRPHPQPGPMKLTTGDPETAEWFTRYLGDRGVAARSYPKAGSAVSLEWCSIPFAEWVESLGVDRSQKTAAKCVPESVWRGSREVVVGFLSGLFDADGSSDATRCRVSFTTTSPGLLRDVQRLLIRFSVYGTVHEQVRHSDAHAPTWTLEVNGANARRFMDHIGFRLERKRKRSWATGRNGCGLSWDRVVSVRPLPDREPVYCLTVDDDEHVFAADGFVSGNSWTHARFYVPATKDEYKVADRVWRRGNEITVIEMGMADNPESVAGGGVARIQNDPGMTEAEKATRLYGKYGYAEGLIFPEFASLTNDSDSIYVLDGLPSDRPYSWFLLCDPNKRHGGLLCAIDHQGNRYYVDEHYAEGLPDRLHAAAYKAIMGRHKLPANRVSTHADPGGAGSQAIINLSDSGVYAQPVPKDAGSVKASIELIRRAAWIDPNHTHPVTGERGAPHCYFLRTLMSTWKIGGVEYHESRLLWELRQYRQKENAPPDTPIKELDDVVDPMRYLELVRPFNPEFVDTSEAEARAKLDNLSRRASEEFDELVKKAQQPKAEKFW